jgi:hypothetical protein
LRYLVSLVVSIKPGPVIVIVTVSIAVAASTALRTRTLRLAIVIPAVEAPLIVAESAFGLTVVDPARNAPEYAPDGVSETAASADTTMLTSLVTAVPVPFTVNGVTTVVITYVPAAGVVRVFR